MSNKILSNQIKFTQYSNNIKNKGIIHLDLTANENIITIEQFEQIEKINNSIKNDYTNLQNLFNILRNELQQIKIENDESYKQLSIMKNNLDNISITNDTIDNELKLLKLSIENVNILNNKLSTENDKLRIENNELLLLKEFLIIEYEKLNNVVNELNNLNNQLIK
jgi:hypothetical protein